MSTSVLKLEASVIRPKDDDELDGLAASISFPFEYDDEAIGEVLGDQDLMAYVVGELHDLVACMRPEWLDNEDTSLTIKAFLNDAECQTFNGLVAMKEDSYTFIIEGYNGENTCGIRKKIECKPRQLSEKNQKWLIMSVAKRLTKMSKA